MAKRLPPLGKPCPRCMAHYKDGSIFARMVQPLGRRPAMSRRDGSKICGDCGKAEALADFTGILDDGMARTAIGNDRDEALRLPGLVRGVMGVVAAPGDLDRLTRWQQRLFGDAWPYSHPDVRPYG